MRPAGSLYAASPLDPVLATAAGTVTVTDAGSDVDGVVAPKVDGQSSTCTETCVVAESLAGADVLEGEVEDGAGGVDEHPANTSISTSPSPSPIASTDVGAAAEPWGAPLHQP